MVLDGTWLHVILRRELCERNWRRSKPSRDLSLQLFDATAVGHWIVMDSRMPNAKVGGDHKCYGAGE